MVTMRCCPAGEVEQQEDGSDEDDGASDSPATSQHKTSPPGSSGQLQAQAALAALHALCVALGAFLSPHLGDLLRLLLQQQLVQPGTALQASAAAVAASLPAAVPPRLLLPALIASSDVAVKVSFGCQQQFVQSLWLAPRQTSMDCAESEHIGGPA